MKRFLLCFLGLALSLGLLTAQSTWDGGGDGTRWEDAANWNPDGVPAASSVVTIGANVTITSTSMTTNAAARIIITSNNEVTLDLNLNVGDGTITEHAIKVQGNGTLNFGTAGNDREFTINAPTNRYGIQHNANGSPATINIASSTTVAIIQSDDGVRIEGTGNNVINNEGTLEITNADSDGIDIVTGSFVNDGGTLNIDDANSNGVNNKTDGTFTNQNSGTVLIENTSTTTNNGIQNEGSFTNGSGTITVDNANTDGIESSGGTLNNDGTIVITTTGNNTDNGIEAGGTVNNSGMIEISGVDFSGIEVIAGADFTNDGTVTTSSAGSGTTRHALFVDDGTFTNNGDLTATVTESNARTARTGTAGELINNGTMSLSGGNTGQRLRLEGTATNGFGAALDVGDGRVILQPNASFTNNGLLLSTRSSTPVFRNGTGTTATNNAFYDGNNGASSDFSSGSDGTETDNGIDLNDAGDTSIDAMMNCIVDLAEQPYTWTDGDAFTGTAGADGGLDTEPANFDAQPVTLTTTIQGTDINIQVSNLCAAALPVELLTFRAVPMTKSVMLEWQTATETNNDYMAVERSDDGRTFTEIGRLNGAGNSNTVLDYELEDLQPQNGINYYRLRQVDADGTTSYSEVIGINFKGASEENGQPLLYPTVLQTGSTLRLDLRNVTSNQQQQNWTLHNTCGQTLAVYSLPQGGLYELDLPSLASGLYLLTNTANTTTTSLKLIITD